MASYAEDVRDEFTRRARNPFEMNDDGDAYLYRPVRRRSTAYWQGRRFNAIHRRVAASSLELMR